MIKLRARDGHELDAYQAKPQGHVRGGVVVAQEMYGVTDYLCGVCDFYASQGYVAIAPALYDRQQRGLTFDYSKDGHDRAQKTYTTWNFGNALTDLNAAQAAIADSGKVGIVGFCWGGTMAWLAACRGHYACAVAYYGSFMPDYVSEHARCPIVAHVGDRDTSFPLPRIAYFRVAQPSVPFHIYEGAQHGFDNPGRAERYDARAHNRARERTQPFDQRRQFRQVERDLEGAEAEPLDAERQRDRNARQALRIGQRRHRGARLAPGADQQAEAAAVIARGLDQGRDLVRAVARPDAEPQAAGAGLQRRHGARHVA